MIKRLLYRLFPELRLCAEMREQERRYEALRQYCSELSEALCVDEYWAVCYSMGWAATKDVGCSPDLLFRLAWEAPSPPEAGLHYVMVCMGLSMDNIDLVRFVVWMLRFRTRYEFDPGEGH